MKSWLISDSERENWDRFVASCPGAPVLQSYEWGEIKRGSGWEPIRIAFGEEGGGFGPSKIAGAVSILKRKVPGAPFSLFYAPRGPVVQEGDLQTLQAIFDELPVWAKAHGALALKIDPFILEDDRPRIAVLQRNGFLHQSKQVQPRSTMIIDLIPNEDDLMAGFESKTRYNIRLAEKKGVTVREDSTEEGVKIFYRLSQETSRRDEFLIHPLSYYQRVRRELVDRGMAALFHATHEGKPIASVFVFKFGSWCWYMYGASSNAYRNVMPNHALHWHIIRWAKAQGLTHYDLWGIPSDPREGHPLYGVYRFKKGFNGKLVKLAGVYDRPFRKILYPIFDRGLALYQNTRSLITKGRIVDSLAE